MKRFVVIGLGNFGSGVAETLHAIGHEVVALDLDERRVDRIATAVSRAAVGDGTDGEALERLGAADADAAVVSTGDDITASVLTTLALRDLGLEEIYVKVISRDHGRVMQKLGVTETVFPERESATRLGKQISSRSLLGYVELAPGVSVQEMAVPTDWVGCSLADLGLPERYRISVIAVHDVLTDELRFIPEPGARLKDSDALVVVGRDEQLAKVIRPA